MDTISLINIIFIGFTTVFSFGLLLISLNSYRKSRNRKLFFVNLVLLFFFIKTLFVSIMLFVAQIANNSTLFILEVFDLLILIFLFIAVLVK
ncbi:hypothetical protein AYK25_06915 [Thermoplasmatales archaeon SM1-50]|nr:MAG: hypothetical protein AYK25_06915 [Thermoplasmatales archaeon SM1-50]